MTSNETSEEVAAVKDLSAIIYHLQEYHHHRHYHFNNTTTANVFNTTIMALLNAVICKSNKTSSMKTINEERDVSLVIFSVLSLLSIILMLCIIIYYYSKRYWHSCRSALNDCMS